MVPVSHPDVPPTKCRKATLRASPKRQAVDIPLLEILHSIEPPPCPVPTSYTQSAPVPVRTLPSGAHVPERMHPSHAPEQIHPMPDRMHSDSSYRHLLAQAAANGAKTDPSRQLSIPSYSTRFPSPPPHTDSPPSPTSDPFQSSYHPDSALGTIAILQADNLRLQNDLQRCEAMLKGMTVTANQAHAAAYAPIRKLCGAVTKSGSPCRRTGRCPFHAEYMEPI